MIWTGRISISKFLGQLLSPVFRPFNFTIILATDAKLEHEAGIKTDLKSEVEQQVGSHGLDTLVNQLKRIINLRPILERIHREEPESLLAGFTSADFLLLNELLMLLDEFFTMLTKLSENQSFNIHLAVALIFNLQVSAHYVY